MITPMVRDLDWKLGDSPNGHDQKYIYSHLGFNLKATDFRKQWGGEPK